MEHVYGIGEWILGCCRTVTIQFFTMHHVQAADPKKATPAPAAAAEAAQTAKAKEEPKPAAKSSEAAADNKPPAVASQTGDDTASVPKKLEKRNSIQLFFKILVRRSFTLSNPCTLQCSLISTRWQQRLSKSCELLCTVRLQ